MATSKRFVTKNGIDNNSNTIINVTDPVNAQDVATKNIVTSETTRAQGAEATLTINLAAEAVLARAAEALKAPIASPTFTGTVTGPTFVGALTGTASNASQLNSQSASFYATASSVTSEASTARAAEALKAPIASPTFTGTVAGITSAMVGLGNVPNLAFSGTNTGDQNLSGYALLSGATFTGAVSGTNLSGSNTGDETLATIKTKLGVTTLSGSNTGDQTLPTTLPASDVSAWAKAATKPSYTATEVGLSAVPNLTFSGSNSGDETLATIKTKLGVTTLSGSNTGDQTITLTGDVTGSGVGSFVATLSDSGVTAATYGSATAVPVLAIDNHGRVTSASASAIAIAESQVTSLVSDLAAKAPLASPTFTGTVAGITPTMVGLSNVPNIAFSGTNTGDETLATIKTKLGITTLSGSNTGDQTLPTTLPASDVSAWAKASTKPSYTATEVGLSAVPNLAFSGSNTGDDTAATIKSKLGITTLSGSNTGDQTLPTTLPASDVSAWAKAGTKPSYTATEVGLGSVTNDSQVKRSEMGAVSGVATLDTGGKIPASQLPSYVDDVLEAANLAAFPVTGETGKIYVALDTNKCYRWSGTAYIYITSGAVDSVAGRSGVVVLTKTDVGLGDVPNLAFSGINTGDQTLPTTLPASDVYAWAKAAIKPSYTATEVGLSAVPNLAFSGSNTGDDTAATIKTKLGITTLSGSNTGDQTLPTTLPASDVSAWAKAGTKPTYTPTEVGLGNVPNLAFSGSNTGDQNLSGYALLSGATFTGAVSSTNLSGTNTGDETLATIKTKLSITTLSGSNTGDQTLPTTLPASDVYPWAKSSTKPSYTATEVGLSAVPNLAFSGSNTGDDTAATIKSKLGITTLSGSNTGDQTLPTTLPASDVYAWAKAATKPSYTATEVGLGNVPNLAFSGSNTGDQTLPTTLPASDVYAWAKAATKPSYSAAEVGAITSTGSTSGSAGSVTSLSGHNISELTNNSAYITSAGTSAACSGNSATATTATNVSGGSVNATTGTFSGAITAASKSFLIDHPTQDGMKLQYGSLESPYHGVRLTGSGEVANGECRIYLPDYIHGLCHEEGAQVQITNMKHGKVLWVEEINVSEDFFTIKSESLDSVYGFYWSFTGIRKDIDILTVEF